MDGFIGRGEWLDWLLRKTKEKIWKKWVEGFKGTGVKCEDFFPLHVKAYKGVSTSEESVTNQSDRMTQPDDVSRWYQPPQCPYNWCEWRRHGGQGGGYAWEGSQFLNCGC